MYAHKNRKIKSIVNIKKKHKSANQEKTIYSHTGILIQNFYDSGHNYNVVIQTSDLRTFQKVIRGR